MNARQTKETGKGCEICGSTEVRAVGRFGDIYLRTTHEKFGMMKCDECGSYFLKPQPTPEKLAKYYPSGYWWNKKNNENKLPGKLMEWYRDLGVLKIAEWIENNIEIGKKSRTVTELGCGTAMLLAAGRDKYGWIVKGYDRSREAKIKAKQINNVEVAIVDFDKKIPDLKSYDLVILAHLIEHLADPEKFLKNISGKISSQTRLVILIPNADSLGVKISGLRWRGFDVPRHLRTYSHRGIRTQLARCGFRIERIGRFSFRDDAAHIAGSIIPDWDPLIMGARPGKIRFRVIKTFVFGILTVLLQPIAYLEGLLGMGETMQIVAVRYNA